MKDENILSWNIGNFVSIVLMIGIIWALLGTFGHIAVRNPAIKKTAAASRTAVAA